MTDPTERTSNYGWAIWHLTKAQEAVEVDVAMVHIQAAQARALLCAACEMGAARGVDPNGSTLWKETDDD